MRSYHPFSDLRKSVAGASVKWMENEPEEYKKKERE
jgi:hypothetical protein